MTSGLRADGRIPQKEVQKKTPIQKISWSASAIYFATPNQVILVGSCPLNLKGFRILAPVGLPNMAPRSVKCGIAMERHKALLIMFSGLHISEE